MEECSLKRNRHVFINTLRVNHNLSVAVSTFVYLKCVVFSLCFNSKFQKMMPAPVGQVSAPAHQSMPSQPPQQQNPAPATELKYDNVNKVKSLIWSLKDALANVMKVAGANVYHSAAGKTSEDAPSRIDKTLEDFFSICNQIELNLKAIQECTLQQKDSAQYLPLNVLPNKTDSSGGQPPQQEWLTYSQYLSTIKGQVNFGKAIQEMLTEGARKVTQGD